MASDVLAALIRLSVIGTAAILLVAPLRSPARRAVGPEAAYWLWLLLPASLIGALLPRAPACLCGPDALVGPLLIRGMQAPLRLAPSLGFSHRALVVTLVWGIGATLTLVYFACCQHVLRRSLGPLQRRPDGTYSSPAAKQPMLIGGWRPRIVLPGDFETRYSEIERALILAHERVHVGRNDALASSIASALVCAFWFNPLMYWAWSRFRFDQEVACDAAVLRQVKVSRRRYARALAKTQLSGAAAIAFGWRRRHPLIERVAILRRATLNPIRRWMGHALVLTLMLCGTYVVWAAQPDLPAATIEAHPRISIGLKWFIDGTEVLTFGPGSQLLDLTPHSGDAITLAMPSPSSGVNYSLTCVPSLQSADSASAAITPQVPAHAGSQGILIACEIRREGKLPRLRGGLGPRGVRSANGYRAWARPARAPVFEGGLPMSLNRVG